MNTNVAAKVIPFFELAKFFKNFYQKPLNIADFSSKILPKIENCLSALRCQHKFHHIVADDTPFVEHFTYRRHNIGLFVGQMFRYAVDIVLLFA